MAEEKQAPQEEARRADVKEHPAPTTGLKPPWPGQLRTDKDGGYNTWIKLQACLTKRQQASQAADNKLEVSSKIKCKL